MVPRVDELKVLVGGRAEDPRRWRVLLQAVLVDQDLFVDGILMLRTVHRVEDLLNQFLLLGSEGGRDAVFGVDIPPVAGVLPFGVIDSEANFLSLRLGEALVQRRRQGVGFVSPGGRLGEQTASRWDRQQTGSGACRLNPVTPGQWRHSSPLARG